MYVRMYIYLHVFCVCMYVVHLLCATTEFYEREAEKRHYFYHIDLQGRLYLEDTTPKNIATSLKSPKVVLSLISYLWMGRSINVYPM